jgi:hypothetical protein
MYEKIVAEMVFCTENKSVINMRELHKVYKYVPCGFVYCIIPESGYKRPIAELKALQIPHYQKEMNSFS